ncbi:MAG: DUF3365 domain-containing protein [Polyangiaceae bacterium]
MNLRGRWLFVSILASALFSACSSGSSSPSPAARAKAKALLAEVKPNFKATLTKALASGPTQAIEACSMEASKLVASSDPKVKVGRATDKPRNAANEAKGWKQSAMHYFASLPKLDGEFYAVPLPGGVTGYAEPIVIQPMCLTCHGKELSGDVKELLSKKYPADQATGYDNDQLRGIFWVEVTP